MGTRHCLPRREEARAEPAAAREKESRTAMRKGREKVLTARTWEGVVSRVERVNAFGFPGSGTTRRVVRGKEKTWRFFRNRRFRKRVAVLASRSSSKIQPDLSSPA